MPHLNSLNTKQQQSRLVQFASMFKQHIDSSPNEKINRYTFENIDEQGKYTGYKHFLLFPKCFQTVKVLTAIREKSVKTLRKQGTDGKSIFSFFPCFSMFFNKQIPIIRVYLIHLNFCCLVKS